LGALTIRILVVWAVGGRYTASDSLASLVVCLRVVVGWTVLRVYVVGEDILLSEREGGGV
jgi:hypothetical protein